MVERTLWRTFGSATVLCRQWTPAAGGEGRGGRSPRSIGTKVLDLCAGKEGWGAAFKERGHDYVALELFRDDEPHRLVMDVRLFARNPHGALDALVAPGWRPDVILASPPCDAFTVAAMGKMFVKGTEPPEPKHATAVRGVQVMEATVSAIHKLDPRYYWVENPRAKMRVFETMKRLPRTSVSYCRYGETRMKPTDLWGVWPTTWTPRGLCTGDPDNGFTERDGRRWVLDDAGNPCHESAPRGSKDGGTQAIKGSADRAVIPYELSRDVCDAVEEAFMQQVPVPIPMSA